MEDFTSFSIMHMEIFPPIWLPRLKRSVQNKRPVSGKKAVGVFGENLPADRTQRREFLDRTFTDEMSQVLSECDEEFYSQTDDLEKLNYQFIMKNKAGFS